MRRGLKTVVASLALLGASIALALGAAPREVLEAVEVAAIPGGMPGLWLGVETLHEILKEKGMAFK